MVKKSLHFFSITFKQYQLRILEMNNGMKLFLKKHICIKQFSLHLTAVHVIFHIAKSKAIFHSGPVFRKCMKLFMFGLLLRWATTIHFGPRFVMTQTITIVLPKTHPLTIISEKYSFKLSKDNPLVRLKKILQREKYIVTTAACIGTTIHGDYIVKSNKIVQ